MFRIMCLMLAATLLAIATSTTVLAAAPNWPKSLTLGTALPGGVYYVYGEAVAKILSESLKIEVNPLPTPEGYEAILKAIPELTLSEIGSGAYTSLDKTYTTVGLYTFAIGRDDLPDELVYQLVKAVFENQPRLVKANPAASETLPQKRR